MLGRTGQVLLDRTLVIGKRRIGVGLVDHDPLDRGTKGRHGLALAALDHLGDHVWGELEIPCIVEFAGFQNRAARVFGGTAALERDGGKGRFGRITIHIVGLHRDHVVGTEFGYDKGTGADRAKVLVGALRRLGAHAVGKLRRLNNRGFAADKGGVGVGGWFVEGDHNGQIVRRFDGFDTFIFCDLRTAAFGVCAVFVGEFHIGRGEWRAIGPFDAGCDFPCDLGQVFGNAAIGNGRDLVHEPWHQRAGFIETRQRLDDHRRTFHVLGAAREIGVQDRRGLPIDNVYISVRPAFGKGSWGKCRCGNGSHE